MRFLPLKSVVLTAFAGMLLASCSDKIENFQTENIQDYTLTLEPGKYIIYRLDSLVFTNFGRTEEVHKYQLKDVVDAKITDNLGRPSYRIFRYLRDTAGTTSWQPAGSYMITPLTDQVEVIEDNLRFIKLHAPIREGYTWKGNRYFPDNPYDYFSTNNSYDQDVPDWDYVYDHFDDVFSFRNKSYPNVWTVESADEKINVPITAPDAYGSDIRSVEKYAQGVGLVYREYVLWEYQPNIGQPGGPYKTGFGITQWMIDHN